MEDPHEAARESTPGEHLWDINDGWCMSHRDYCSMAPTQPPTTQH